MKKQGETIENIVKNGRKWFKEDFTITFKVNKKGKLKLVNMEDEEDSGLPSEMLKAMTNIKKAKKAKYIG